MEEYVESVVTMPPAQHAELSGCDKHFNAIVKAIWRAKRGPEIDQARDVIHLLSIIDRVEGKTIRGMFERNYFLKSELPTMEGVRSLLSRHRRSKF